MKKITYTIVLLFFTMQAFTQYQIGLIPRKSPDNKTYQKVGLTDIEISYGSPKANGRTLWGDLIPYNSVWRAGANNATVFETSGDLKIQGKKLPKGKYALFLIPRDSDKWTFIFNKNWEQWGAFKYKEAEDVLRVDIIPQISNIYKEHLEYTIENHGFFLSRVNLQWGNKAASFEIETDYTNTFIVNINNKVKETDPNILSVLYLQGAEHLIDLNKEQEQAEEWLTLSQKHFDGIKEWNKLFYPKTYVQGHIYWEESKLLAQKNKPTEALKKIDQIMNLENNIFYKRKKEEIDNTISSLKKLSSR